MSPPSPRAGAPDGPRAGAVVVAAGGSTRMRGAGARGVGTVRKPWLEVGGACLLEHACRALLSSPRVVELVVVVHADDLDLARELAGRLLARGPVSVVAGGRERCDSVASGLAALSAEVELALVHDAARPLVLPEDVTRTVEAAAAHGAALLAEPVADTLKRSADGRVAAETVERAGLWKAQTPQVLGARRLRELLERARREGFVPTDEAALWERYVGPVALVEGRSSNFKVTRPADLELAAAVLAARAAEATA